MKHKLIFSLFFNFLLANQTINAQEIKIISEKTAEIIEQVFITNQFQNKSCLTNEKGIFNISEFNSQDTLYFQHAAFQSLRLPFQYVKVQKFVKMKPKEIRLNEIVISANKWEENIDEIPNKISKIDYKTIVFENPQTSADLLKNTAGVYIQKSQMGGGSPMIRGFAANSVLLMFDGIRMNNSIYRSGNLQNIITIDPFLLQDSEIIFGPGSIVYGSDALGGVIDFHSREIVLNDTNSIEGQLNSRYSSYNEEKTAHFHVQINHKKWGSFTSFSYNSFADQIMGSNGPQEYERPFYAVRIDGEDKMIANSNPNKQVFTGYNQFNFMQKLKYKPNDKVSFDYIFYYTSSSDIPRYDRLIQMNNTVLKYASWYYGPQQWLVNSLIMNYSNKTILWDAFKLQANSQFYKESRHDRKFGNDTLNSRFEDLQILSLNADFNKKFTPDFFFFYGFEVSHDKLESTAHKTNIVSQEQQRLSTRYPDGKNTYDNLAFYSAFRYKMSKKVDFSGGLRYSNISIYSDFINKTFYPFDYDAIELDNDAITASLGFVYRSEKNTKINMNLSSGFRSPNIDDIAKVFDSEPGSVVVPNPNLKPEYVYNIDFGIKQDFIEQKLSVETILFYSYLDNAMVRGDFSLNGATQMMYDGQLSDIQAIINTGFAKIYGITAQSNWQINDFLRWNNGFNWISGYDNDGNSIRHAPPIYGNSSLNLVFRKWQFRLEAFYNGEIAFEDLAPIEADKPDLYAIDSNGNPYSPAWFVLNFKSIYQLSQSFSIHLEMENLTDKRYRTYSSGVSAPGRGFRISLNYKF